MGFEDVRIRDISRVTGEWAPSVGALGGPPSHELYRELVVYADLRLFRDGRSRPWVVMRDGAHRHAFPVPSTELRGALDRFRLRRNVRPLPDGDIEEFVRIVEARVTDPDVQIPLLRFPLVDRGPASPRPPVPEPEGPTVPRAAPAPAEPWAPAPEVRPGDTEVEGPSAPEPLELAVGSQDPVGSPADDEPRPIDMSRSGGVVFSAGPSAGESELQRYVRVLRRLVRDGDWMGTTRDLSEAVRDDPFTLYTSLLRYRSEIAENNILIASVEDRRGLCWLAVDRSRVRSAFGAEPPDERPAPAP